MEKVSVAKCDSYEGAKVRKALEDSLKNINFSFKKGAKILIKPNLLSASKPEEAITTHPMIVLELCKILKRHGAEIYIGESSAFNTDRAFKVCGYAKLAKYAKIINFEAAPKKLFDFGKGMHRIPLPKIAFDADLVINIAKMKTHGLTQVTLCVKNLYGCIPGSFKEELHKILPSPKNFSKLLLKIEETIKPGLNIIDGVVGIEGEGPGASGKIKKSKVIVVSRDAIAADIIGTEIMGFNFNKICINRLAKMKREEIEAVGNGKNLKLNFKKPRSHDIQFALHFLGFLPKPKITFNYGKCERCRLCETKCPAKAIKLNPWPECNHKKCIRCLCCIEVCPNSAIYLKAHWIRQILVNIYRKFKKV
jgi:uncharacterized protein (DUF362 family)/NAD-dependent dihydropyrimidine dehydrogenase PreA subunit